ncbi:hypothetical protein GW916_11065 [bacterium]|nr:hypothetical protein [bacterium]
MSEIEQLKNMVTSMEEQLKALYEAQSKQPSTEVLQASLKSLESQLISLYEEKSAMPIPAAEVAKAIASLEEQVISLTDEKMECQAQIFEMQSQLEMMKRKGKALGAAVFEAALFSDSTHNKAA